MELEIFNHQLIANKKYDDLTNDVKELFEKPKDNKIDNLILRSKHAIVYKEMRFRFILVFKKRELSKVILIAMKKQDNPIYSMIENTNERHIKWLLKNYGEPTDKKSWGIIYPFSNIKITSEYDPRSGTSEIVYDLNISKDNWKVNYENNWH